MNLNFKITQTTRISEVKIRVDVSTKRDRQNDDMDSSTDS